MSKLKGKVALVTGASRGIGRAIAERLSREGAAVAINYTRSADEARQLVASLEAAGGKALAIQADVARVKDVVRMFDETIGHFGRLDILVNNAATQTEQKSLEDISSDQLKETFETNIFSQFWMTKYALKHLTKGSCIINTTSVTAYRGSPSLIDYSSTKGAILTFTRSLAANLIEKGIRVNAVAPGPIWTPLIVGSFDADKVKKFGSDVPMKRAGEPVEVASCYLFLASEDASYITGQVLHPNGGEIVNG